MRKKGYFILLIISLLIVVKFSFALPPPPPTPTLPSQGNIEEIDEVENEVGERALVGKALEVRDKEQLGEGTEGNKEETSNALLIVAIIVAFIFIGIVIYYYLKRKKIKR